MYRERLKSSKLKMLWKQKTGTETPRAWSIKHRMPILCLIPDAEVSKAKTAFDVLNRPKANEMAVDKAMEYLSTATFFNVLDDDSVLDKAFRDNIIKSYAVMLTNVEEVKDYLYSHVDDADPYDWFGLPEVENKIRQMAEAKYNREGCEKALEKIDKMDVSDVKRYLKELIKDNMVVGMEIIKGD